MKIAVIADGHYERLTDGSVFVSSIYDSIYWQRYLNTYEKITVIARGTNVEKNSFDLLSGREGVDFNLVYDFHGIWELACNYFRVKKEIESYIDACDGAIVRIPSPLSRMAINYLIKMKKPFLCEMVADPAENYDSVPFSKVIKRKMESNCRKACLSSNGVLYVTKSAFQKKYPSFAVEYGSDKYHYDVSCSNVNLSGAYVSENMPRHSFDRLNIIHVSNVIDGKAKGHYVCLEILRILRKRGIEAQITFVGDGPEISKLKKESQKMGIEDSICFTGRITDSHKLYEQYMAANVFLLPSKTEGLPRSLIEAMACGLVCFASNVGGIPDVLKNDFLFPWESAEMFADAICKMTKDCFCKISEENYITSKEYFPDILSNIRNRFYDNFKNVLGDCSES